MDPLSLTASIIGIATLAEGVVTKLSKYCKAVKNCEEEVRKLMVEVNVLAALLERLARLAEECNEEQEQQTSQAPQEDSAAVSIPAYISACQSTLKEIELVLITFERKGARVSVDRGDRVSAQGSLFSRLPTTELKWPFSKSKTLEIIANLERYKSTCILALAADELSDIREVLAITKLSNKVLAEIKSNSDKVVQFYESKETKEILQWFGPVNPAFKHREFRKEYQEGTGYWIFDTSEFVDWMQKKNSGLWIYAIPGAGKTILAQTLSSSRPRGFAYFYCRYNDPGSQRPASILGSLVAQLCQQDPGALEDALVLYSSHNTSSKLPTTPTEEELGNLLKRMSLRFEQVSLVLDGLDEVGAAMSIDRVELVRVLSTLHKTPSNIRIIIFSRAEADIKDQMIDLSCVSIAARSSDLQLYVAAKMQQLLIKDSNLRLEVLEALVDGADGMFFWTVCQIQLLKNLPTPAGIRQALKSLPPGLPATYCRIFERIDSEYPVQTQLYIQRALNWLVWAKPGLPIEAFVHAISMDDVIETLEPDGIPEQAAVLKWLGCLVRLTVSGSLELAHFSTKEFLLSSKDSFPDCSAQKYLAPVTEKYRLAVTCFSYLSLLPMHQTSFNLFDDSERGSFEKQFPFYGHAALRVSEYVAEYDPEVEPPQLKRLFKTPNLRSLYLWIQYTDHHWCEINGVWEDGWTTEELHGDASHKVTALHVACELQLVQTVRRLLSEGSNPNVQFARRAGPLHLVIVSMDEDERLSCLSDPWLSEDAPYDNPNVNDVDPRVVRIVEALIDAHCDVNLTARYDGPGTPDTGYYSPLYVAFWIRSLPVCRMLIDNGALIICDMNALYRLMGTFRYDDSWKSEKEWLPILDLVLDSDNYEAPFRAILEEWRLIISPPQDSDDELTIVHSSNTDLEQLNEGFLVSVAAGNKDVAAYYLDKGADINALDQDNQCALAVAVRKNNNKMAMMLGKRGLSWNFLMPDGTTPLILGFTKRKFKDIEHILPPIDVLQLTDNEFQAIFEFACGTASLDILNLMLRKAATQNKTNMLQTYNPEFLKGELELSVLEVLLAHGIIVEEGRQKLFLSMCTEARMHLIEKFLSLNPEFDPSPYDPLPFDETGEALSCRSPNDSCCVCWATTEASPAVLSVVLARVVQLHTHDRILGHLGIAAQRGHCGIAEELLKWGDDPNRTCSSSKSPILYAAHDCIPEYNDPSKMIKIIETAGGDIAVTYRGNNAIHYAMENSSLSAVTYLASRGVDLHAANCQGERPLHIASFQGFKAGVDFILQDRLLIDTINEAADDLGTPLYCAARGGYITIAEQLLGAGALINVAALPGNTLGPALYAACAQGHAQIVTILLSHGADPNVRGPRYHSASEVAIAYEQSEVLEALEKYGKSSLVSSGIEYPPVDAPFKYISSSNLERLYLNDQKEYGRNSHFGGSILSPVVPGTPPIRELKQSETFPARTEVQSGPVAT